MANLSIKSNLIAPTSVGKLDAILYIYPDQIIEMYDEDVLHRFGNVANLIRHEIHSFNVPEHASLSLVISQDVMESHVKNAPSIIEIMHTIEALTGGDCSCINPEVVMWMKGHKPFVYDLIQCCYLPEVDQVFLWDNSKYIEFRCECVEIPKEAEYLLRDALKTFDTMVEVQKITKSLIDVEDFVRQYMAGKNKSYAGYVRQQTLNPEMMPYVSQKYDELPIVGDKQSIFSYEKMKPELLSQFRFLKEQGLNIQPSQQDPYPTSRDMVEDVKSGQFKFLKTPEEELQNHPLGEKSGEQISGQSLRFNDLFRVVHDFFGHGPSQKRNQFGPRGETNAFLSHERMFPEEAKPALTTETIGQNSYNNAGPYSDIPRPERPFAEQKSQNLDSDTLEKIGDWLGIQKSQSAIDFLSEFIPNFLVEYSQKKGEDLSKYGRALWGHHSLELPPRFQKLGTGGGSIGWADTEDPNIAIKTATAIPTDGRSFNDELIEGNERQVSGYEKLKQSPIVQADPSLLADYYGSLKTENPLAATFWERLSPVKSDKDSFRHFLSQKPNVDRLNVLHKLSDDVHAGNVGYKKDGQIALLDFDLVRSKPMAKAYQDPQRALAQRLDAVDDLMKQDHNTKNDNFDRDVKIAMQNIMPPLLEASVDSNMTDVRRDANIKGTLADPTTYQKISNKFEKLLNNLRSIRKTG